MNKLKQLKLLRRACPFDMTIADQTWYYKPTQLHYIVNISYVVTVMMRINGKFECTTVTLKDLIKSGIRLDS